MHRILLFLALFLTFSSSSECYEKNKVEVQESAPNTALFVLIDETTPFNDSLKEQVISNAKGLFTQGTHVFVGKFSAFISGKYNETLLDKTLENPLSNDERNSIGKNTLSRLDLCLKKEILMSQKELKNSISGAFLKQGENIAKSDILYALKDFAGTIKENSAKRKIIILASDMLENSVITSFYSKNAVRGIDSAKELTKVEKEGLITDFGGAEVYVIGAGLTANQKSYVNPKILNSLNNFWSSYFEKSNAKLVEFGTPALKKQIK